MTTALIIQLITTIALVEGVDPKLALTIAKMESSLKVNAIGPKQEVGLFQILPDYSKYSKKDLLDPVLNTKEGMRILKQSMKNCKHKEDNTFIVCYNAGNYGGSKIRHPKLFPYYKRYLAMSEVVRQKYVKN